MCTGRRLDPRSQQAEHQPSAGLLPRRYLIGEGVSLPRITEHPFVLGRCPGSDTRWRLHPSGSARGRRDHARSSRPATTKATWRSADPEKRWVLPVSLPCCLVCTSLASGGQGAGHRLISHSPELSTSPLCSHGRGAAGDLLTAAGHTFYCPLLGRM